MFRIPHQVRFWSFLVANIISLSCTLFTLYFLLADRTLRRALHNHVIIVLLILGLIYEVTVIPWFLHNDQFDTPWSASRNFYLIWAFLDYGLFSLQLGLFAWATMERHILIFHDRWVSTPKRRFLIHHLPVVGIITYYMVFYCVVYFVIPCNNSFDGFLTGGIYTPCAFESKSIALWDLLLHQVIATLIIIFFSLGLLARVVYQKIRVRQPVQWRKHRKMTIQLCAISLIYFFFNSPWVIVILAFVFGLSLDVVSVGIIYGKYVLYYIIFSFPLVSLLSLSELRAKFLEKILFQRPRRRVGFIAASVNGTLPGETNERTHRQ